MSEHTEFALLDEFVLGTLDAADAARVAEHVRICGACRAEYDELRSVVDVLPHALASQAAPAALRDRIFAAIDPPAERNWTNSAVRGLAAALVLALIGDALLALALGRRVDVALAPPPATAAPVHPTPTSVVRASIAPTPGVRHRPVVPMAAATARPSARPATPMPAPSNAKDEARIAALAHDLAVTRLRARADRERIASLQSELAFARAKPRIIVVTPPPVVAQTAVPVPDDDRLVAALRTGRVYAIDGEINAEPWHLTIVAPRDGEHAVVYSGTPDAPSGDTYRTWVVRGKQTFDAGELPPGKQTTLEMPMGLLPGDVVAFSREPLETRDRPSTRFLMELKIGK